MDVPSANQDSNFRMENATSTAVPKQSTTNVYNAKEALGWLNKVVYLMLVFNARNVPQGINSLEESA